MPMLSSSKIKRICFDIGSNYFHDFRDGFLNDPSEARAYFAREVLRFDAATTFDSVSRRFKDFIDHKKLLTYLLKADEIITFNGRICDFIVLEKLLGEEAISSLWRKPHHDLCGWQEYSLKRSVSRILPNMAASFDQIESRRFAKIRNSCNSEFIAQKLANTYRDVKFTFALFERYLASESSNYTFHDI